MTMPSQPKISVLIIDDESHGRDVVRMMLKGHQDIDVLQECSNGIEAREAIKDRSPDLIFLDIKMPGLDGIEMLRQLKLEERPYVVFVTAYNEYALQAFEEHALDYLLKPFDQERFDQMLDRARGQVAQSEEAAFGRRLKRFLDGNNVSAPSTSSSGQSAPRPCVDRLVVKESGRVFFLNPTEVDWLEAAGNYVSLHVGSKTHMIYETMGSMEQRLDPNKFVRIHRSTIVNVDCIKEMQSHFNGEYIVILNTGDKLKLSRSYRDKAKAALGIS